MQALSLLSNLSFTSAASAGTTVAANLTGLAGYSSFTVVATTQGGTGGTLDLYFQMSPDGGNTWVDYAHYPQLTAGAAASTKVFSVSRNASQLSITAVGTGTSPSLAANTVIGGDWGDRLRIVQTTGAGTTAGAAQTFLLYFSS